MQAKNVSNIQVAVRIRPPLEREISEGQMHNCVAVGSKLSEDT
jgi:hypothetical protein